MSGRDGRQKVHVSKEHVLPRGGTIADFHVYTLEWEPGEAAGPWTAGSM